MRPHTCSTAAALLLALAALAAGGCAATAPGPAEPPLAATLERLLPTELLLVGEQHDADSHQRLQREAVRLLAARGELAALALEMAEAGRSTAGLPMRADEAAVRQALAWNDAAWPWHAYGPVVMAAVRAGVPVLGANLPRAAMRDAMRDASLDARLPPAALERQRAAVREGHCGLLAEAQIAPMTRIQIARDISMADTLRAARVPGRTVLLVAGAGHVRRDIGVPAHLPAGAPLRVLRLAPERAAAPANTPAAADDGLAATDARLATPAAPETDHCAALREQLERRPPARP